MFSASGRAAAPESLKKVQWVASLLMRQKHCISANDYYIDIHMQPCATAIYRWLLAWWMHFECILARCVVILFWCINNYSSSPLLFCFNYKYNPVVVWLSEKCNTLFLFQNLDLFVWAVTLTQAITKVWSLSVLVIIRSLEVLSQALMSAYYCSCFALLHVIYIDVETWAVTREQNIQVLRWTSKQLYLNNNCT